MTTGLIEPFALEDFFDEFEHRRDLVNLASSDAQPWTTAELNDRGVALDGDVVWSYPDLKQLVLALERHCALLPGMRVIPTTGAAEAIALVVHYLASMLGDQRPIGVPRPAYGAFAGLARALKIPVRTYDYLPSQQWKPDIERLIALAETCRAVVINNPHNPTGHVLDAQIVARVLEKLSKHGGVLVVDAVFAVKGDGATTALHGPNVFVIGSLSKTYGLPGLRLGWVSATQEQIRPLRTLQQYLTLSPVATTVALGVTVLNDVQKLSRSEVIRDGRAVLTDWVQRHSKVSISTPEAGTTVCLAVDSSLDESALFEAFLREGVLLAPGKRCFGVEATKPWFRLGYAVSRGKLCDGLERIERTLERML